MISKRTAAIRGRSGLSMRFRRGLAVPTRRAATTVAAALVGSVCAAARAVSPDIGVIQLRSLDPTLNGANVSAAQVEATGYTGSGGTYDPAFDLDDYQVNPAIAPAVTMTYRGKT